MSSSDLLGVVQRLQTRVNALEARTPSAPTWGTIASLTPLRVLPDLETEPLEATPQNGAGPLRAGDRVLIQRYGTQLYVWGPGRGGPPGVVVPYAGATAPPGWLICDGATYAIRDYPELAAVLADITDATASTFAVPDLRGRVVAGADSTDSDFARGTTGGEKEHVLTTSEIPAHNHALDGYTIFWGQSAQTVQFAVGSSYVQAVAASTQGNGLGTKQNYWNQTQNKGSGAAHNNLQPYMALNYIIRT